MRTDPLNGCCGIGEITSLKRNDVYVPFMASPNDPTRKKWNIVQDMLSGNNISGLVKLIEKARNSGRFPVVIATTPDKDDWWMFHIALPMAGFVPVARGKTKHVGEKYNNILWVFERN